MNLILQLQKAVGNRAVQGVFRLDSEGRKSEFAGATSPLRQDSSFIKTHPSTAVVRVAQLLPEIPLGAYVLFNLRNDLKKLADNKNQDYIQYRNAIFRASEPEKLMALGDRSLLIALRDTLDGKSFARCVEGLGRQPPTFDVLRKDSTVLQAINDAWKASDVGVRDLVTQPHEEGGWVFQNLIDGSLSIQRATPEFTDALRVEPAPQVPDSVLVAVFHTHPSLRNAGPSRDDLREDKRRGVPNLVAANKGNDPKKFQIYLSGPPARKHLASDTSFPGPSGGVGP